MKAPCVVPADLWTRVDKRDSQSRVQSPQPVGDQPSGEAGSDDANIGDAAHHLDQFGPSAGLMFEVCELRCH
jgi:hypothetical protein